MHDLTRLARIYVSTGDPVYERHFHDVLAIRNNAALTDISALVSLRDLGGSLLIEANPSLPTCAAEALRDQLVAEGFIGAVSISGNDDTGSSSAPVRLSPTAVLCMSDASWAACDDLPAVRSLSEDTGSTTILYATNAATRAMPSAISLRELVISSTRRQVRAPR